MRRVSAKSLWGRGALRAITCAICLGASSFIPATAQEKALPKCAFLGSAEGSVAPWPESLTAYYRRQGKELVFHWETLEDVVNAARTIRLRPSLLVLTALESLQAKELCIEDWILREMGFTRSFPPGAFKAGKNAEKFVEQCVGDFYKFVPGGGRQATICMDPPGGGKTLRAELNAPGGPETFWIPDQAAAMARLLYARNMEGKCQHVGAWLARDGRGIVFKRRRGSRDLALERALEKRSIFPLLFMTDLWSGYLNITFMVFPEEFFMPGGDMYSNRWEQLNSWDTAVGLFAHRSRVACYFKALLEYWDDKVLAAELRAAAERDADFTKRFGWYPILRDLYYPRTLRSPLQVLEDWERRLPTILEGLEPFLHVRASRGPDVAKVLTLGDLAAAFLFSRYGCVLLDREFTPLITESECAGFPGSTAFREGRVRVMQSHEAASNALKKIFLAGEPAVRRYLRWAYPARQEWFFEDSPAPARTAPEAPTIYWAYLEPPGSLWSSESDEEVWGFYGGVQEGRTWQDSNYMLFLLEGLGGMTAIRLVMSALRFEDLVEDRYTTWGQKVLMWVANTLPPRRYPFPPLGSDYRKVAHYPSATLPYRMARVSANLDPRRQYWIVFTGGVVVERKGDEVVLGTPVLLWNQETQEFTPLEVSWD